MSTTNGQCTSPNHSLRLIIPSLQGGADRSLARPVRKQATVTKLGFYSTHSPWSSIHFLGCCSNFCKPFKRKFRRLSVQPGLHGINDLHVRRKVATFQLFFSVQGTGGGLTGRDPENRVGDQDTGSPGRPVSSGLQMTSELGHCHARIWPPWWPSHPAMFSFKMSFNCTSRDEEYFALIVWPFGR